MVSIEEFNKLQASHPNFVIHPLSSPIDNNKSPGKRPLLSNWQHLKTTPEDIKDHILRGCNVGLVCGKSSGVDAFDLDNEFFRDELFNGVEINTLISGHRSGRGHVIFQHEDDMKSEKHHFIGIEYFGNSDDGAGSNLVLPPSIHKSGEVYKWINQDSPIMKMPDKVKSNWRNLADRENELYKYFKKCRPCFTVGNKSYKKDDERSKGIWERPDSIPVHNKSGRDAVLAIMGELKSNGCPDNLLLMACKRFFGKDYNEEDTKKELQHIEPIRPKCDTLRSCLSIDCSGCTFTPENIEKKGKKLKEPLQLPPIPQEEINQEPITIEELLKTYKNNLYVEEDVGITIPLSEVLSNFAPIEPDIMGIIAPSGSSKTELIRSLGESENQFVYPVSSITEHTLVSGLEENIDLAPSLRGRLLTIKDFTTILSKNKDKVSEIFADFRELTDGHIGKDFGSGVKKHYTGIHTSVLFGCTNAIENYNSLHAVLGQRILFFRPRNDRRKAMQQARINSGRETEIRDTLHKITLQFINNVIKTQQDRLKTLTKHLTDEQNQAIEDLAFFLSIVRTPIAHDYRGDLASLPEPEYPTRLAKTICKLVDAHSMLYNREPNESDLMIAYRLTSDNVPTERLRILKVMLDGDERTTSEIQELAKLPNGTTRRILDDLKSLEIIEYFSMGHGRADVWQLSDEGHKSILTKIINFDKLKNTKPSPDAGEVLGKNRMGGGMTVNYQEVEPKIIYKDIENQSHLPREVFTTAPNQEAEAQQEKVVCEKSPILLDFGVRAKDWIVMNGQTITNQNKVAASMWIAETTNSEPSEVMRYLEKEYKLTPEA